MRPLRDLILYCDRPSDTARELSRRLNARRLFGDVRKRLRQTAGAILLNYGTSRMPSWDVGAKAIVLNKPEAIQNAISKVKSHDLLSKAGIPTLAQTTLPDVAAGWLQDGCSVLARRDGLSGGKGIVFLPKGSQSCPPADFYTKYFPKTHEFRAHVVSGRLIDLTLKKLQNGKSKGETADAVARIVRSLENGWIHAHEFKLSDVERAAIEKIAVGAVEALGLDFGAVDILGKWNTKTPNKPPELAVCEVNTAPGLGNEVTLKAYVEAFGLEYNRTKNDRLVVLSKPKPKRVRVKKMVLVEVTTKKGARVKRMRERLVYE